MTTSLVGYSGFVGSNLSNSYQFSNLYNSKNIEQAFGTKPDLLVYSGVRAEKYLANQFPEQDFEIVKNAYENIQKIEPKKVVLISTIDVYKNPIDVDEDSKINIDNLHPYGLNRFYLESWIENEFDNSLIVRLPGLYGINIKKNFIFDMINLIPSMLKDNKFDELCSKNHNFADYYVSQNNGFYKCKELSADERIQLKVYLNEVGFSALNFTDSRGRFQFYNLNNLWHDIQLALSNNLRKLNLATEPITISELYQFIYNKVFINEVAPIIPDYNFKTNYAELFNSINDYICSKDIVLSDIKKFVGEYTI